MTASPSVPGGEDAAPTDAPGPRCSGILVVGAGPCGLSVGVAARRAGVSCILVEKGSVVNTIAGYPTDMTFFSTADRLELGGLPFVLDHPRPTRSDALAYYRRVCEHFDLDLRQDEEAVDIGRSGEHFVVATRARSGRQRRHRARAVVVATGSFDTPVLLNVPGEGLAKVSHYFREAHACFRRDVLVVGGGNSAVEAALAAYRAGARISMVHQFDRFDDGVKPWILPDLQSLLRRGAIRMYWRHRVERIEPETVSLRKLDSADTSVRLANDVVLAMTGYRPALDLLVGLPVDSRSGTVRHDPNTMETEERDLFVAGVLAAGSEANRLFIENGRRHGSRIVSCLKRRWRAHTPSAGVETPRR